jgi:hypothetical protein
MKKYAVYNLVCFSRNRLAENHDKDFTLHGCRDSAKRPVFFTTDPCTKIATRNLLKYGRQTVYIGVA